MHRVIVDLWSTYERVVSANVTPVTLHIADSRPCSRCSCPPPPQHRSLAALVRERCTLTRKDTDNYCRIRGRNNLAAGRDSKDERERSDYRRTFVWDAESAASALHLLAADDDGIAFCDDFESTISILLRAHILQAAQRIFSLDCCCARQHTDALYNFPHITSVERSVSQTRH